MAKYLGGASTCDFESSTICGFTQDVSGQDNFDWTRQSGATSKKDHGPMSDHTLGTNAGMLTVS